MRELHLRDVIKSIDIIFILDCMLIPEKLASASARYLLSLDIAESII